VQWLQRIVHVGNKTHNTLCALFLTFVLFVLKKIMVAFAPLLSAWLPAAPPALFLSPGLSCFSTDWRRQKKIVSKGLTSGDRAYII
jgi:hypothetical protein